MLLPHAMRWLDRLLGQARWPSWEPDQLTAAVAAATLVLEGKVTRPRVEVPSYAPARQFEVDWALALALRAVGRDAGAEIERAWKSANAIEQPAAKQRALLWGAIELRDERWSVDGEYRYELAARDASAIAALPATWTLRTDVEAWHGYPRWLGGAAMAASVIGERELVAAVEDKPIDEDWRANREYRALAIAWARLGETERAFAAASQMPGSERASAIVELLELVGDEAVDRLAALANGAMQATKTAPFVIVGGVAKRARDREALREFAEQANDASVVAAIARRHLVAGDAEAARALIATIPDNLSVRHEAALQIECARVQRDDEPLDELLGKLPRDDYMVPNLVRAAGDMRCMPIVHALVRDAKLGDRFAAAQIRRFIYQSHLDDAAALLRWAWQRMTPVARSEAQAELVGAFAEAGRPVDALALFRSVPAHEAPICERSALAAGYRLIVPLVVAEHGASELYAELGERLTKVAG